MGDAINKVREQLGKMAEDVLREAAIPGEIEKGWELEIICFADAEKRLNSFYGSWGVVLHPPKGQSEQYRVLLTSSDTVKEFKTLVGLVSFQRKMGFRVTVLPLCEGETVRPPRDTWSMPQDD